MEIPIDMIPRRSKLASVMASLRNFPPFRVSREALIVVSLFLVTIVGYIDYLTGYERPLLLFYLLPISLAAWFGSLLTALGIAVVSIAVSLLSDVAAGIPALGFWNIQAADPGG